MTNLPKNAWGWYDFLRYDVKYISANENDQRFQKSKIIYNVHPKDLLILLIQGRKVWKIEITEHKKEK